MGKLQLMQESGGPRHYLDGHGVHAGQCLELALGAGVAQPYSDSDPVWLKGRYEWSFHRGEAPTFYFELGDGRGESIGLAKLELPEAAILRWPEE